MGRYERETHARYCPDGKKMQKYKIRDEIEKRKWTCNTDLRINIKLVRVYYGRWHAHNLTEDQVHGHSLINSLGCRVTGSVPESNNSVKIRGLKC